MKIKNKVLKNKDVFLIAIFVFLVLYVLSLCFVLYMGFINSLKTTHDSIYDKNFFGFPNPEYGWLWQNYASELFDKFVIMKEGVAHGMWSMLFTSILYSVLVSATGILNQAMVAYAVTKYNFKLKKIMYTTAIVVMFIPIVGSLPAKVAIMDFLHLKGSIIGVCFLNSTYTGIYFLVFCATFSSISSTYAEAAKIDGAGHLTIFIKIMLPLVANTLFAVFILQFIANWNDYYTPMIFLSSRPTIAYALFEFKRYSESDTPTSLKLSASIFTCIPIIILFIIFRNKIMGNISIGGIKG